MNPAPSDRALLLCVERDPHIRSLERFFLEEAGFAVEFADDGAHGLRRATDERPVIVISEILLPRIEDDGTGIPGDLLPRVFDLFAQGKRSSDRAQGGLGIGLTLVRSLAELHGGSAHAWSGGANLGSEFTVRLPRTDGAREASSPCGRDEATTPRVRVLVVEDNADAAEMLAEVLKERGHAVEIAADGNAALTAFAERLPDVALVDIGLPEMDGYEVARRVRAEHPHAPPVLVALTGYGQESDRRRAAEAGFDEHLVKPVGIDAIERVLRRVA